jgi:hypothetical protein
MIREREAKERKQRFILCRYALVFVTGAVGFIHTADSSPAPIAVVLALAIASNLYLGTVSPFSFFDAGMQAPILVMDTAMVSTILLLARASQEFFLFFFFVLIMAAKVENLVLLGAGASLIGIASFLMDDPTAGSLSPLLMRVPFMLATAMFYGYIVLPERTGQMMPMRLNTQAAAMRRV